MGVKRRYVDSEIKELRREICTCKAVSTVDTVPTSSNARENTLYIVEGDSLYYYDGTNVIDVATLIGGANQVNNYKDVNANYTVLATDYTVDNFTSGVTTTLLSAVGIEGQIFNIANSSGGDITIDTTGSETIYLPGGSVTTLTLLDGENLTVQSTGSNWRSL